MERDILIDKVQEFLDTALQEPALLFDNWDDLDCLSSGTRVEEIFVDPDSFIVRGKTFTGVGEVSVELSYGGRRDETLLGDSYPIKFSGTIVSENSIEVSSLHVDTSSFYQ